MAFVTAKCTQCGANIQVDSSKEAGICEYCRTAFVTEKAIKNIQNQVINNYGTIINNNEKSKENEENSSRLNISDLKELIKNARDNSVYEKEIQLLNMLLQQEPLDKTARTELFAANINYDRKNRFANYTDRKVSLERLNELYDLAQDAIIYDPDRIKDIQRIYDEHVVYYWKHLSRKHHFKNSTALYFIKDNAHVFDCKSLIKQYEEIEKEYILTGEIPPELKVYGFVFLICIAVIIVGVISILCAG